MSAPTEPSAPTVAPAHPWSSGPPNGPEPQRVAHVDDDLDVRSTPDEPNRSDPRSAAEKALAEVGPWVPDGGPPDDLP